MKNQLIELAKNTVPKSLGGAIKRNSHLKEWLLHETRHLDNSIGLSERAYLVISDLMTNICSQSQKPKRFVSYVEGYAFCGRAMECSCAKTSIGQKVSAHKKNLSQDQISDINSKRSATNLDRYGVENSGQTSQARLAHQAFYSDPHNVQLQLAQQKITLNQRYGVDNAMKLLEIKQRATTTVKRKYGVNNVMLDSTFVKKAQQTKADTYSAHYLAKKNHSRFVQNIRENFGLTAEVTREDYVGVQSRPLINFRCLACDHQFEKRFDYANPPRCLVCHPREITYKSREELSLLEFVKSLNLPSRIISGDRSAIKPYEIDIFIPDLNFGIEYCGLYWHSEKSGKKSWNYHARKFQAAAAKNIELLTIFSDEWLTKRSIVERLIENKLGVCTNSIFARKCEIAPLTRQQAMSFHDQHHLIGSPKKLPINLGLVQDNETVAVMSFLEKTTGHFELTRFSSQGRIIGGASRLLKNFQRIHQPSSIVSFSDNRYSNGKLYQTLGFQPVGRVPPMQSYVCDYQTRTHKRALNRHQMLKINGSLDMSSTEWVMAQCLGYDRIWDCGKIKWRWALV